MSAPATKAEWISPQAILAVVGLIGSTCASWGYMSSRVEAIKEKVEAAELSKVPERLARIEAKIDGIERYQQMQAKIDVLEERERHGSRQ